MVGNGIGDVSYGGGKDEELPRTMDKAYAEAVRNVDYIEGFENRTVLTETQIKLGMTSENLVENHDGLILHHMTCIGL